MASVPRGCCGHGTSNDLSSSGADGASSNFANVDEGLVDPVVLVLEVEIFGVKLVLLGDDLYFFVVVRGPAVGRDDRFLEVSMIEVGT